MRRTIRQDELFDFTDKTVKVYLKKLVKEYSALVRQINALPFDEVNALVISSAVSKTYDDLEKEAFIIFCLIYARVYKFCFKEHYTDGMEQALVTALLEGYNGVTKYVYTSECDRKRARLYEAIMGATEVGRTSAAVRSLVKKEVETAQRLFARQIEQYADNVTCAALLQAYTDAGVKRFKWVAVNDEKTCGTCKKYDGKVYNVDDLPPYPAHYYCRCILIPMI